MRRIPTPPFVIEYGDRGRYDQHGDRVAPDGGQRDAERPRGDQIAGRRLSNTQWQYDGHEHEPGTVARRLQERLQRRPTNGESESTERWGSRMSD